MKITNKREFYALAEKGLCGNTPRTWKTADVFWGEVIANSNSPVDRVGLRTLVPGDGRGVPVLSPGATLVEMEKNPGVFYVSEIPPKGADDKPGLQGEFTWVNGEWWMYYTHNMGYMRQRLAESGQHAYGWAAHRLLRGHLTPSDYSMLMDLFDRYTEDTSYPVIEFANFRKTWGRMNRNLIIWEVRNDY